MQGNFFDSKKNLESKQCRFKTISIQNNFKSKQTKLLLIFLCMFMIFYDVNKVAEQKTFVNVEISSEIL